MKRRHSVILKLIRIIIIAVLAYLAVMFILTAGAAFLNDDVLKYAFVNIATVMPFGSQIASFTLKLMAGTLNYTGDLQDYETIVRLLTPVSIWENLLKILVIAISSKVMSAAILAILGIFGKNTRRNIFLRAVCNIAATLICTFSAAYLMQMLYDWMALHPIRFQDLLLAAGSLIGIGGAVAYPVIFLGMTFLGSLMWVAVMIIFANVAKVVVTYAATLMFLVYLNGHEIVRLVSVVPVWAVIMAVIVVAEVKFER